MQLLILVQHTYTTCSFSLRKTASDVERPEFAKDRESLLCVSYKLIFSADLRAPCVLVLLIRIQG